MPENKGSDAMKTDVTIAVVSAGLSQPSSTRLLADRLAEATRSRLETQGHKIALRRNGHHNPRRQTRTDRRDRRHGPPLARNRPRAAATVRILVRPRHADRGLRRIARLGRHGRHAESWV